MALPPPFRKCTEAPPPANVSTLYGVRHTTCASRSKATSDQSMVPSATLGAGEPAGCWLTIRLVRRVSRLATSVGFMCDDQYVSEGVILTPGPRYPRSARTPYVGADTTLS